DCGDARARHPRSSLFFFHDTAAAALYTRSLHDALPIFALSLPALAHRVTVFGSTRNMDATSAGVSKGSGSCVRDAIGIPPLLPDLPRGCGRPPICAPTAGFAGRARLYGPSSPRCPTWSERLIVIGCMGDEFSI